MNKLVNGLNLNNELCHAPKKLALLPERKGR
jgi:hypothetical protein